MSDTPKPKRKMSMAAFCAMACNEGAFHKYLTEEWGEQYGDCADAIEAVKIVRFHCKIKSRTELNKDGPARELWLQIKSGYEDWLRA